MTDEAKALVEHYTLTDDQGLRQLHLLYNHVEDDSRQFTRWQMLVAINHGIRVGIETQAREIERLREAVGILEDGLQEVGDDYPGSSCQEWCQHQIKQARAALGESHD